MSPFMNGQFAAGFVVRIVGDIVWFSVLLWLGYRWWVNGGVEFWKPEKDRSKTPAERK